jgi:hypothetical protein
MWSIGLLSALILAFWTILDHEKIMQKSKWNMAGLGFIIVLSTFVAIVENSNLEEQERIFSYAGILK